MSSKAVVLASELSQRRRVCFYKTLLFSVFLLIGCLTAGVRAAEPDEPGATTQPVGKLPPLPEEDDSADFGMGLGGASAEAPDSEEGEADELLLFEDMPVVVSAARKAQPMNWLSMPVSVITSEDIRYSGKTKLPDVLQRVPGVDVIKIDRNRYAVGVRGLHSTFSDRTLVLVDGRSAENPAFGGGEFFRIPVLMSDIERVEVVRGPGGAAWGANAFNGVINIITKDPSETQGWMASTRWTDYCDSYSHVRWGSRKGDWRWRTSIGYANRQSSTDALNRSFDSNAPWRPTFDPQDFSRNWRMSARAVYQPTERTKYTLDGGYSYIERGTFGMFGSYPSGENEHLRTVRLAARADHEFRDGSSYYLQWYGTYQNSYRPSLTQLTNYLNSLEGQYNFTVGGNHHLSVGGNVKAIRLKFDRHSPADMEFPDAPFTDYWVGAFVIDRWEISKRLMLEGQFRIDYYNQTTTDWSGRLTALYALDDQRRHVLRLSGAKAFRAPLAALREMQASRPLANGWLLRQRQPVGDLDHEQIWSLEAGYNGQLTEHLSMAVDGYYQQYRDLIGFGVSMPTPGVLDFRPGNNTPARAWGAEAQLTLKYPRWSVSGWYAYNGFRRKNQTTIRSFLPAKHKVGVNGRVHLPHDLTLDMNYRFSGLTRGRVSGAQSDYPRHHKVDLAVTKEFKKSGAEFTIGVEDLFNTTEEDSLDVGSFLYSHESPGRTFFARLKWKF
ncbi:MAG: TonB-dependent receptor plug domain-containing protein [Phycisphaerae bacterium]